MRISCRPQGLDETMMHVGVSSYSYSAQPGENAALGSARTELQVFRVSFFLASHVTPPFNHLRTTFHRLVNYHFPLIQLENHWLIALHWRILKVFAIHDCNYPIHNPN